MKFNLPNFSVLIPRIQNRYDDTTGRNSAGCSLSATGNIVQVMSSAFGFFLGFGLSKQRSSKCDLKEGQCLTKCAAIAILALVDWLRQTSKKVAVEPITYNIDFCKSFKIV